MMNTDRCGKSKDETSMVTSWMMWQAFSIPRWLVQKTNELHVECDGQHTEMVESNLQARKTRRFPLHLIHQDV
jgi:hypothetical protein